MTTELLERDSQLAAITRAHEKAAAGRGSVVLVTGEAGIGKTSLATRFVADLGRYGRVLSGTCDDLAVPRPLGPFHDFVAKVSGPFQRVLAGRAPAGEAHWRFLEELSQPPRPVVLVLEDVHWADGATLDVVTYVGRRVATLPVLVILTYRDREVPLDHPLHVTLSSIRASVSHHLALDPLSTDAVTTLVGEDAENVYELTGGNPFFVSELAGWPTGPDNPSVPPSVTSAVAARVFRLGPEGRDLVEAVSVVPGRIAVPILSRLITSWEGPAEEGERAGLLIVGAAQVRFRHELARTAVRDQLTVARRRHLHREVLEVLLETDASPADIVYHAEEAGATEIVGDHIASAAREALDAESYREAYLHYLKAIGMVDGLTVEARPQLFEELATTAHLVGEIDTALPAVEQAIDLNRRAGNTSALGRNIRILARLRWNLGDTVGSADSGRESVTILEPLGDTVELARSYNFLATGAVLSSRNGDGIEWGERALDLARRLGDRRGETEALITTGAARFYLNPDETSALEEAYETADSLSDRFEAQRALLCLAYGHLMWIRPDPGLDWAERLLSYTRRHGLIGQELIALSLRARYHLREGKWNTADEIAQLRPGRVSDFVETALLVTEASLAVRRGDPGAESTVARAGARADQMGDLMRHGAVLASEVELSLVTESATPMERATWVKETIESGPGPVGAEGVVAAAWASVAGRQVTLSEPMPPAYEAMTRRDWSAAADAFGDVGWIHDRALMLSLLDEESAQVEALEIALDVGADALAERVRRRMRALDIPVPLGPRASTRANPARLTNRQVEVLTLLTDGLTNPEIAERLYVSPRTIDRHVHGILRKLGVGNRQEAASRAAELGVI